MGLISIQLFLLIAVGTLNAVSAQKSHVPSIQVKDSEMAKELLYNCKGKSDGPYLHPSLCTKFIVCANEFAYEMDCPDNLHYAEALKLCQWPRLANCPYEWDQLSNDAPEPKISAI